MGLREDKPDSFLHFRAHMTANDDPVDLASVRTNLAAVLCHTEHYLPLRCGMELVCVTSCLLYVSCILF